MRPGEALLVDRRAFLVSCAGSLLAAPLAAEAPPEAKVHRVGVVFSGSREESLALVRAFEEELQERGYVEAAISVSSTDSPRAEPIVCSQSPPSWRNSPSMCS